MLVFPIPSEAEHIVQVVKQRKNGKLSIDRRIVQGCKKMIARLIEKTQGGGVINTDYIERLNATFRQRLAWLARRTRCLAQQTDTMMAGMFTVGNFYNFSRRTLGRCATTTIACVSRCLLVGEAIVG